MKKFQFLISVAIILSLSLSTIAVMATDIKDGELIKTADSFDIYIVKINNNKKFKRLILNPEIFDSYDHLKWEDVRTVSRSEMDEYSLAEFVIEVNPDGSVADPKVYRVTSTEGSDVGERQWLNLTAEEFESLGYDWDSIYFINSTEASPDFYPTMEPFTYEILSSSDSQADNGGEQENLDPISQDDTSQADTTSPIISEILAGNILAGSVEITWNTDEEASALVKYGTDEKSLTLSASGSSMDVEDGSGSFTHSVGLIELAPNTKYYFQSISTDTASNASQIVTNSFTTTDCYGDVPNVHTTIQEAIDAVSDGQKICLSEGAFSENVVIDGKNVRLVGQGPALTSINAVRETETPYANADTAPATTTTLIVKNVDSSTIIENISIKNGNYYAIWVEDASPIIRNNHINENFAGIQISGNSRPTIEYNVFANNTEGAVIAHNGNFGDYNIDHNTFVSNGKTGGTAAISLNSTYNSSPMRITSNIFSDGYSALDETSLANFYFWYNLIYNNSQHMMRRENSYYYSISAINDLGVATKNVNGDPLLNNDYTLGTNSPALGNGENASDIGAK